MKKITWQTVTDYSPIRPPVVDMVSSPTTIYLNRHIVQRTRTEDNGDIVTYWECMRAQLTKDDYTEYVNSEGVFSMPEFLTITEKLDEQELAIMETCINTEYIACLNELSI